MLCRLPLIIKGKGKDISIIGHEGPRRMWIQRYTIFTASALGRDRVASPMLGENPPVLIL